MSRSGLLFAPGLLLALVSAVCLGSGTLLADNEPTPAPSASPSAGAEPTPDPSPTPSFDLASPTPSVPEPSPTVAPPAHAGPLKAGDWVRVTSTGSCLNVRTQPTLAVQPGTDASTSIYNCLPDGFVAQLGLGLMAGGMQMPMQADGHWWWYLLGQGWAAEDWLTFDHEGGIPYPHRGELASAGLIAYIGRDSNVWVMKADGTSARSIATRSSDTEYFGPVQWSPRGNLLSFTVRRYDKPGSSVSTRIVNTSGVIVGEVDGLTEAVWSPDGTRVSAIHVEREGEMGGYYGRPVVFDVNSGRETALGPSAFNMYPPAWSPDGTELALVCSSLISREQLPDGTFKDVRIECGGDGLQIVSADGTASRVLLPFTFDSSQHYSNPSWSPDGDSISVSTNPSSTTGCRGYSVVTVASGAIGPCIALPAWGGLGGMCGGSSEMGASDWSPDGEFLAYHSGFGAGSNGVYVRNLATGATRVIPNNSPSGVSFSSDGAHLTFGGSGYIWVADTDATGLALLAEGSSPAWQPR